MIEYGIAAPAGVEIDVVEASDSQGYLLLPPMPAGRYLAALDHDMAGYWGEDGGVGALFGALMGDDMGRGSRRPRRFYSVAFASVHVESALPSGASS